MTWISVLRTKQSYWQTMKYRMVQQSCITRVCLTFAVKSWYWCVEGHNYSTFKNLITSQLTRQPYRVPAVWTIRKCSSWPQKGEDTETMTTLDPQVVSTKIRMRLNINYEWLLQAHHSQPHKEHLVHIWTCSNATGTPKEALGTASKQVPTSNILQFFPFGTV